MIELNGTETDLLRWLAQEDFSQYGECNGKIHARDKELKKLSALKRELAEREAALR